MTLFVLCGQVVAAPFLVCRNMLAPVTLSMEEHCAEMMMEMASGHDATQMPLPADNPAHNAHATSFDCDFMCQLCRGLSSVDAPDPVIPGALFGFSWTGSLPALSLAVQPPSDHFRPPATA